MTQNKPSLISEESEINQVISRTKQMLDSCSSSNSGSILRFEKLFAPVLKILLNGEELHEDIAKELAALNEGIAALKSQLAEQKANETNADVDKM